MPARLDVIELTEMERGELERDLGGQQRPAAGEPGHDCAAGRCRAPEHGDRRPGRGGRGHGGQVAPPVVLPPGPALPRGRETLGPPVAVHPGADRLGQVVGLPAARGQRCAVVSMELPGAGPAVGRGRVCASISSSTIGRWLTEDAIKPWPYQSWIFIRDLDFAAKAARVLDLYARTWDGAPLTEGEYVVSA